MQIQKCPMSFFLALWAVQAGVSKQAAKAYGKSLGVISLVIDSSHVNHQSLLLGQIPDAIPPTKLYSFIVNVV